MMVGRTAKARTASGLPGVPRGPKTSEEPSAEWPSRAGDDAGDGAEDGLAEGPLDDEEGEEDLEAEAPGDGAPADGAAVGGEGVGEGKEGDEAEEAGETVPRTLRDR